ncbi:MAG: polynucleotide adenylyltransferase PcnB [Gammaproteobacteria bacterium]
MSTPEAVAEDTLGLAAERIDPYALTIIETLRDAGHEAYIVGGGVRDLLLDARPKDFDVATSAHPEAVRKLFRRSRLIGRRFPIVHVLFGREFIEVTTFRAQSGEARQVHESGRILRDSSFGSLAEDAVRRDFTVNALYYDPLDRKVLDFTDGLADVRARRLRLIGDPATRYREDPVRMLRAVRFAAKLDFEIEEQTAAPLAELAPLLADIPPARLFEEVCKLFLSGYAGATFAGLRRHGMFGALFPLSEEVLAADTGGTLTRFVAGALASTDARVRANEPVTIAFLLAAFLWPPTSRYAQWLEQEEGIGEAAAVQRAIAVVLGESKQRVSIPQRFAMPLREIVQLQSRFRYRHGKRAESLLAHPRFRAAYDFLKLRAEVGDAEPVLAEFWDQVQRASGEERRKLLAPQHRRGKKKG